MAPNQHAHIPEFESQVRLCQALTPGCWTAGRVEALMGLAGVPKDFARDKGKLWEPGLLFVWKLFVFHHKRNFSVNEESNT